MKKLCVESGLIDGVFLVKEDKDVKMDGEIMLVWLICVSDFFEVEIVFLKGKVNEMKVKRVVLLEKFINFVCE